MFYRDHHQAIAAVLDTFNSDYFYQRRCYFGGGTLLALDFGEYRESVDIDFLISDKDQIRTFRSDLHAHGCSSLFVDHKKNFELIPSQTRVTRDKVVFAIKPKTDARPVGDAFLDSRRSFLDPSREVKQGGRDQKNEYQSISSVDFSGWGFSRNG